jgi:hypothetical protein
MTYIELPQKGRYPGVIVPAPDASRQSVRPSCVPCRYTRDVSTISPGISCLSCVASLITAYSLRSRARTGLIATHKEGGGYLVSAL